MASSKEYLNYILEQLRDLEDLEYRPMMGEFILYYRGKIIGGIYDDRLLVKPVKAALDYVNDVEYTLPYEGAREMLAVDDVDDRNYLKGLFEAMYGDLPSPRKKQVKKQ